MYSRRYFVYLAESFSLSHFLLFDLQHEQETKLIYTYSPFRCEKDLLTQFDKIKGPNGSLIIAYNMKLLAAHALQRFTQISESQIFTLHGDLQFFEFNCWRLQFNQR